LARFLDAPSFVRSFAYASGPAYGLLLDQADPGWHRRLDADADLGALLARAHGIGPPDPAGHAARVQRYDRDGSLGRAEDAREQARAARVAAWRATLVDGPRLVLPLARTSYQFNPQTLATLDGIGTVYPSLRLTDAWGELVVVEGGAALAPADRRRAAVALPANRAPLAGEVVAGEGWPLTLAPGWTLVAGEREGDMTLAPGPHWPGRTVAGRRTGACRRDRAGRAPYTRGPQATPPEDPVMTDRSRRDVILAATALAVGATATGS